jgi:hypothetical protein
MEIFINSPRSVIVPAVTEKRFQAKLAGRLSPEKQMTNF